jgi:hypothetical protein
VHKLELFGSCGGAAGLERMSSEKAKTRKQGVDVCCVNCIWLDTLN